jgi:prepilin-type N-terminal cleavage/methylation domain-containing protein
MLKSRAYTLTEILVVLVIIGILAVLAWPNYMAAVKEKTLNREAKASLALIRAAEKIYKMEQGFYYPYPPAGITPTIAQINSDLKLSLSDEPSVNPSNSWKIGIDSAGTVAEALRQGGSGADGRTWEIDLQGSDLEDEEPVCTEGTGHNCP